MTALSTNDANSAKSVHVQSALLPSLIVRIAMPTRASPPSPITSRTTMPMRIRLACRMPATDRIFRPSVRTTMPLAGRLAYAGATAGGAGGAEDEARLAGVDGVAGGRAAGACVGVG